MWKTIKWGSWLKWCMSYFEETYSTFYCASILYILLNDILPETAAAFFTCSAPPVWPEARVRRDSGSQSLLGTLLVPTALHHERKSLGWAPGYPWTGGLRPCREGRRGTQTETRRSSLFLGCCWGWTWFWGWREPKRCCRAALRKKVSKSHCWSPHHSVSLAVAWMGSRQALEPVRSKILKPATDKEKYFLNKAIFCTSFFNLTTSAFFMLCFWSNASFFTLISQDFQDLVLKYCIRWGIYINKTNKIKLNEWLN